MHDISVWILIFTIANAFDVSSVCYCKVRDDVHIMFSCE